MQICAHAQHCLIFLELVSRVSLWTIATDHPRGLYSSPWRLPQETAEPSSMLGHQKAVQGPQLGRTAVVLGVDHRQLLLAISIIKHHSSLVVLSAVVFVVVVFAVVGIVGGGVVVPICPNIGRVNQYETLEYEGERVQFKLCIKVAIIHASMNDKIMDIDGRLQMSINVMLVALHV